MNASHATECRPAWEKFFGPATHQASEAMGRWTQGQVVLSLDEVCEIPLEEIADRLRIQETLSHLVVLEVAGALGGQLILIFDDENANQLVASLLHHPLVPADRWSELERSALRETGNILGSAYLNCITALTGRQMLPAPPQVFRDYVMSVVQQAVMSQALTDDRVLLARTRFRRQGADVEWNMLFIPSPELLDQLSQSLIAGGQTD
jgi:chemotaxis protein CheC